MESQKHLKDISADLYLDILNRSERADLVLVGTLKVTVAQTYV